MRQFLLDTNAFLRYILNDVLSQADEITQVFIQSKKGEARVTVPIVVFLEATYVLTKVYGYERSLVKQQCEMFFAIPSLDIPDRYVLLDAYATWTENLSVSFADCVLLHMARIGGKELLTFDKGLQRLSTRFALDRQ